MAVQLNTTTSPLDDAQIQRIQSAVVGLSPVQIAWVSGYLAGSAQHDVPAIAPSPAGNAFQLTILYGSQTGNARGIAEDLSAQAQQNGLNSRIVSMADYAPRKLSTERLTLFVVSTHGEGEPPESAFELHRFLTNKRAPRLEQLQYAVLGLGDSSYTNFCQTAKDFDKRLDQLGARRLFERVDCDVDFHLTADGWRAQALERVAELMREHTAEVVPLRGARAAHVPARFTRTNPYVAQLVGSQRVTTDDAVAHVQHLELSVDPGALPYTPGDSLGVWFRNDPALVDELIAIMGADGESRVSTQGEERPLRDALLKHCELTRLHPAFVQGYAELTTHAALLHIVSQEERLKDYLRGRQVIDVVREFPKITEPSKLIALLRPLEPRLYSIASSPLEYDEEIHLTVSMVNYRAFGHHHLGAASGYLTQRLGEDEDIGIYVVENPNFRLPSDPDRAIIMIAAGTGVAPYRAFLQHRESRGENGRNWLIFGNRHFHKDFLYQLEWQRYHQTGLLTRVDPVFSRDQQEKVYVQHRLLERGKELYKWLEEGAHVYVCGDTGMARDVHQALLAVVAKEAQLTADQASEYVDELRRQARYQRDVY